MNFVFCFFAIRTKLPIFVLFQQFDIKSEGFGGGKW